MRVPPKFTDSVGIVHAFWLQENQTQLLIFPLGGGISTCPTHAYGGWEVQDLQSKICKLETQESQWYSASPSSKAWEAWKWMCKFQVKSQSKQGKVSVTDRPQSRWEKEFLLLALVFLFYSGLQWMGWDPPTLRRAICCIQSADSSVCSSRNTFSVTPKITSNQIPVHPVAQIGM